jgi:hypothetical protein
MSPQRLHGWSRIVAEAQHAFAGAGRFPLPAYSELMPPPYVGIKPYVPRLEEAAATAQASETSSLDITEYEQTQELAPGLARISGRIIEAIVKLARGGSHDLSRTLLADNPAWPPALAEAAKQGKKRDDAVSMILSVALSRTQDDKGNVRWTLFGTSHEGSAAPFFASFGDDEAQRFARVIAFARGRANAAASLDGVRILAKVAELPAFAKALHLTSNDALDGVEVVVTFRPFAALPTPLQQAFLDGAVELVPSPASLVFGEHPRYRGLAATLPRAMQLPLLSLFPRVQGGYGIRIPQSGWLDELGAGHKVARHITRSHRWQRGARDDEAEASGDLVDAASVALFSCRPDDLNLYGKPMARNAQVWRDDYRLLLDGPRATVLEIERAAATALKGGRFGYRLYYPPMRAGRREIFWLRPLVAKINAGASEPVLLEGRDAPLGYVVAEHLPEDSYLPRVTLTPRFLARPGHHEAATLFDHDAGQRRFTTCYNIRRLLDFSELLGRPLAPSVARSLLRIAHDETLEKWLTRLPELAHDRAAGERVAAIVRQTVGDDDDPGPALTLAAMHSRDFEEYIWKTIEKLASEFRAKDNADAVTANHGRSGGPAAAAIKTSIAKHRDLERLGDHLHTCHRELIAKHGMTGKAFVADQAFRWETHVDMPWSDGWLRNQRREAHERNIVVVIPGRDRTSAIVMADHYDTAYMEDVYDKARGGDGLRAAAAGADDNHSATTALLCAADVLLPLARDGKLARDVWLVHLTGEEFPADCLGARALAQALVERRLRLVAEDGAVVDVSQVRVAGVYVLDMIAHNNDRDRDVFQIAAGEGAASARLAVRARRANVRWNILVKEWNRTKERAGKGRAQRHTEEESVPPPFAHLAVEGEIRTEWEPRSSLFNTDGQIFSDVGVPVVLFMENYDINRSGYHDTHDTMKNIDLDYAAALTAIAIESVADAACSDEV